MALKLTPSGTDLLLRAIAGEVNIKFTAIQLGNGADAGKSAAALSNPLLTAEISSYEVGDVFVTLRTTFSNSQVSASFRATEVGVLAHDPDTADGTLLYAYQYTPEGESDYIPASADKVLETQMDVLVYIGDAENVTASISQSLVYASRADLEAHVKNMDNPHKVTKEQVGLGNVPNAATNDLTPTYNEARALVGMKSGEKLSIALGKLAKAVSSLIAHMKNGENPHKVTAKQVGAAAASHKHSTNDLTGGVLGVARGGTGVTGYDKLKEKIGSPRSARFVVGTSVSGWEKSDCDYLCDGTDDQEEINAALAALPDSGGTVIILGGDYSISENITIAHTGTELAGNGGAVITGTANQIYVVCGKNDCYIHGLTVAGPSGEFNCDRIKIIGLRTTVENCRTIRGGISMQYCTNCIVRGNYVGNSGGKISGIDVAYGSENLIANNIIGGYFAIYAQNTKGLAIIGNAIDMTSGDGIYAANTRGISITGNIIRSNKEKGGTQEALSTVRCRNVTVSGNYMEDAYGGCYQLLNIQTTKNFVLTGNTFIKKWESTDVGHIWECENGIVRLNNVIGASGITTGFRVENNTDVTILDNLVSEYDETADV